MNIDKGYLDHCIACAPECDLRSVRALCLIDGAILGALDVRIEHTYRMAHHRDARIMAVNHHFAAHAHFNSLPDTVIRYF